MSQYDSKWVKCPYYIENSNTYQIKLNQIRCEGVNDETTTSLSFGSKAQVKRYKESHCYSIEGCKRCRIHRMLDEKWGVANSAEK